MKVSLAILEKNVVIYPVIYIDVCSLSTFNREYLIKKNPKGL